MNLNKNLLFNNINKEEIDNILEGIRYNISYYDKGEIISNEGDRCYSLGLIIEGNIEIQRIFSNGRYYVLKKLSEGDVFGEALVFISNSTYPATIVACKKCKVLFITKEEFIKLALKDEKILENFITLLSSKVIILNEKIKNLSFKSLREKVANYILEESKESNNIELKDTKEEIAAYLGMPRPSFSRELNYLKENGIIEYGRKNIKILDRNKLEKILGE